MIDRYTTLDMQDLFSDDTKLKIWREVEIAAASAQGAPSAVMEQLELTPAPDLVEVEHQELFTRHDVVAFLDVWRKQLGAEAGAWVHKGMTSSDLVDTANAIRLKEATAFLLEDLVALRSVLAAHATQHQHTYRVGRTHGQTAELTTWGHRVAEFAVAVDRAIRRFNALRAGWTVGKLSGPVGTYSRTTAAQELETMNQLGLWAPQITSQIVMRDVYADYVFCCAQAATAIETLAMEIRLSSRTDTGEVAEGFGEGQRGSSSMPHKRNPITSEQLCGLARLVRAQIEPVMQGVASHHERDISHSSVERVALADVSNLTHYMVKTATRLVLNLQINSSNMLRRVTSSAPELMSAALREQMIALGVEADRAWRVVAQAMRHGVSSDENLVDALQTEYAKERTDSDPLDIGFYNLVTNRPKLNDRHIFDQVISAWV